MRKNRHVLVAARHKWKVIGKIRHNEGYSEHIERRRIRVGRSTGHGIGKFQGLFFEPDLSVCVCLLVLSAMH